MNRLAICAAFLPFALFACAAETGDSDSEQSAVAEHTALPDNEAALCEGTDQEQQPPQQPGELATAKKSCNESDVRTLTGGIKIRTGGIRTRTGGVRIR